MKYPKTKPYRSKAFMRFCHEYMSGPCALCSNPWTDLHHFGNDGGKGMKPSDTMLVRLCRRCHQKFDFKAFSLEKNERYGILIVFQIDALELNRAYIEYLEGK
jgi:hypothetical protein